MTMDSDEILRRRVARVRRADPLLPEPGGGLPDFLRWMPECPREATREAYRRLAAVRRIVQPPTPPAGEDDPATYADAIVNVRVYRDAFPVAVDAQSILGAWLIDEYEETETDVDGELVTVTVPVEHPRPVLAAEHVAGVDHAWRAAREAGKAPPHPLNPLVRAWLETPRQVSADRQARGIMPKGAGLMLAPSVIVVADREALPDGGSLSILPAHSDGQLRFPDFDGDGDVPAFILMVVDSGGDARAGASAPLHHRNAAELLMLADRQARGTGGRFVIPGVTVADLVEWYGWNPADYRPGRPDMGKALSRGLKAVNTLTLPLSSGGWLAPFHVEAVEGLRLTDRIIPFVRLLPGDDRGASLNRAVLRMAGKVSAVAWRAYIGFAFDWNHRAKRFGRVLHLTRPEYRRDGGGNLVGANGEVLTDRRGRVLRSPYLPKRQGQRGGGLDPRVVRTGAREPNPEGLRKHRVYDGPRDLVRIAWPFGTKATRANPARTERQVVSAVRWLAGERSDDDPLLRRPLPVAGVKIIRMGRRTKGNPDGFPWRVVPPETL